MKVDACCSGGRKEVDEDNGKGGWLGNVGKVVPTKR